MTVQYLMSQKAVSLAFPSHQSKQKSSYSISIPQSQTSPPPSFSPIPPGLKVEQQLSFSKSHFCGKVFHFSDEISKVIFEGEERERQRRKREEEEGSREGGRGRRCQKTAAAAIIAAAARACN